MKKNTKKILFKMMYGSVTVIKEDDVVKKNKFNKKDDSRKMKQVFEMELKIAKSKVIWKKNRKKVTINKNGKITEKKIIIVNVLIIINIALIKRLAGLFIKFLAYISRKLTQFIDN